jgi:hypothetical protein
MFVFPFDQMYVILRPQPRDGSVFPGSMEYTPYTPSFNARGETFVEMVQRQGRALPGPGDYDADQQPVRTSPLHYPSLPPTNNSVDNFVGITHIMGRQCDSVLTYFYLVGWRWFACVTEDAVG